jgi:prevent-host-death family protein
MIAERRGNPGVILLVVIDSPSARLRACSINDSRAAHRIFQRIHRKNLDISTSPTSLNPMKTIEVGAFEAKTHLSKLLDAVEKGDRVLITRHGKCVAELSPVKKSKRARFGCAKGPGFYMAPDFDAPLEDFREYT